MKIASRVRLIGIPDGLEDYPDLPTKSTFYVQSASALRHTACSSRGPWYLAHAKALSVALPTAYFKSLGLPNLEDAN